MKVNFMANTIKQTWVTTLDNPFDPFDEYDAWARWDEDHGYNTLSYMMRIANVSQDESDETYWQGIETAVDEICDMNLTGNYRKVEREVPVNYED